jgi:hypothetical protein
MHNDKYQLINDSLNDVLMNTVAEVNNNELQITWT